MPYDEYMPGDFLGLTQRPLLDRDAAKTERVIVQRPLDRVLAFTGRSIDDVVNSPIAKNQVLGYYKLHQWVQRGTEISDMERAWNPLGMRT
jgi:hypothetical protein